MNVIINLLKLLVILVVCWDVDIPLSDRFKFTSLISFVLICNLLWMGWSSSDMGTSPAFAAVPNVFVVDLVTLATSASWEDFDGIRWSISSTVGWLVGNANSVFVLWLRLRNCEKGRNEVRDFFCFGVIFTDVETETGWNFFVSKDLIDERWCPLVLWDFSCSEWSKETSFKLSKLISRATWDFLLVNSS